MKIGNTLMTLALAGALLAGGVSLAPSFADDRRAPAVAGETQWLPLPKLIERLEAGGYREIEKIERERGRYEVRATDRQGTRVKLYLHPHSGELLDQRQERRWRDDSGSRSGEGAGDCNKRRCRDDLPAAATTSPAAPR